VDAFDEGGREVLPVFADTEVEEEVLAGGMLYEIGESWAVKPLVAFDTGFEEGANFDADARSAVEVSILFERTGEPSSYLSMHDTLTVKFKEGIFKSGAGLGVARSGSCAIAELLDVDLDYERKELELEIFCRFKETLYCEIGPRRSWLAHLTMLCNYVKHHDGDYYRFVTQGLRAQQWSHRASCALCISSMPD